MDEKQRQEVANFRYGLIASAVTRKLNPGEQAALLREIASHTYDIPYSQVKTVSLRTLERYLKDYREGGWEALLPSARADKLQCKQIAPDVLEKAIALKQESPTRSVRQIMAILELAKFVEPGALKESTLSKQLRRRGMTRKALEKGTGGIFRRFEAEHRNACWQGDVQHTLYLPHPEQKGKKKMAYLVVFLDDYSRYVLHGQFYFEERVPRLEDCLKKALLKHGIPNMIYVDYAEEKTMPKKPEDAHYNLYFQLKLRHSLVNMILCQHHPANKFFRRCSSAQNQGSKLKRTNQHGTERNEKSPLLRRVYQTSEKHLHVAGKYG